MSDLINGREMLNRYQVDLCYGIACKDCSMCTEDGGCRVEKWIDTFPPADRPQGYWTKTDIATYRCSECGKKQIADDVNELNFCCCCGSRNKVRRLKGASE